MKIKITNIAIPLSVVAIALGISACGGGGGGSSFKKPLATSSEKIEITKDNYTTVAKSGLHDTQDQVEQFDDSDESTPFTANSSSNTITLSAIKRYMRSAQSVSKSLASQQAVSAQGTFSEKGDCEISGSASFEVSIASLDALPDKIELDDENPIELSSGDYIKAKFNDCTLTDDFDVTTSTLDGTIRIDFGSKATEGNCATSNSMDCFVVSIIADGFTETEGGTLTSAMDGGIRLSADVGNEEFDLVFDDFYSYSKDNGEEEAFSIDGYIRFVDNEFSMSMDISSSELDASLSISTPDPLTYDNGLDSAATDGTMVIVGANNATLTIDILGDGNVQLMLDEDGDGTVDETQTLTWEQLENEEGLYDDVL